MSHFTLDLVHARHGRLNTGLRPAIAPDGRDPPDRAAARERDRDPDTVCPDRVPWGQGVRDQSRLLQRLSYLRTLDLLEMRHDQCQSMAS